MSKGKGKGKGKAEPHDGEEEDAIEEDEEEEDEGAVPNGHDYQVQGLGALPAAVTTAAPPRAKRRGRPPKNALPVNDDDDDHSLFVSQSSRLPSFPTATSTSTSASASASASTSTSAPGALFTTGFPSFSQLLNTGTNPASSNGFPVGLFPSPAPTQNQISTPSSGLPVYTNVQGLSAPSDLRGGRGLLSSIPIPAPSPSPSKFAELRRRVLRQQEEVPVAALSQVGAMSNQLEGDSVSPLPTLPLTQQEGTGPRKIRKTSAAAGRGKVAVVSKPAVVVEREEEGEGGELVGGEEGQEENLSRGRPARKRKLPSSLRGGDYVAL